jgi:Zn-dependent protease with chaperone function
MSFYDLQDDARKKSKLLILYFAGAVMMIIGAVDLFVYSVQVMSRNFTLPGAYAPGWDQLFIASAITLSIILLGSLYRYWKLRDGGRALAMMVGAMPVELDSKDPDVVRFVNVVSEMSIASGVPMPELYVMEYEEGINAFVAGYGPSDTVLVVTKGALNNFERDELQGVIAHEYSHIFHGDVRLNMHIMAVLAGVMLISQLGGYMIRGVPWSEEAFYRNKNIPMFMPQPLLVVVGIIIWLIGSIGLLFGELIQAGISRQREYLADASAVQFTRNPTGLAKALARIHGHIYGSRLSNFHAQELRHICIGETVRDLYDGMFNTHPPLTKRIKAVDPSIYHAMKIRDRHLRENYDAEVTGTVNYGKQWALAGGLIPLGQAQVDALASDPTPAHTEYARSLLAAIPDNLLAALHMPEGARGAVYALLTPYEQEERGRALRLVRGADGYEPAGFAERLCIMLHQLGPAARLPMLDLAMPGLRRLNGSEKDTLKAVTARMIGSDKRVTLFEYVLYTLVNVRLIRQPDSGPRIYCRDISKRAAEAGIVLSAVSWAGTSDAGEARSSFDHSMHMLGLVADSAPLSLEKSIRLMDRALDGLESLAPKEMEKLIGAIADCVARDGQVMVAEGELVRAIAERLGSPVPPLLPEPGYLMDHPADRGR